MSFPCRVAALVACCFAATAFGADPADDPLPPGAKARFGISRPVLTRNPSVALVPPQFTTLLAPTVNGNIRPYDVETGRPLIKGGPLVGPGQVVVNRAGTRAVVARPGLLTVIDVATRKQLLAVQPPEGVFVVSLAGASLSGDGTRLAYGGRGKDGKGVVVVWDVDKNEAVAQFDSILAAPVFPLLSQDGKTLVTHGPPPAPPIRDPDAPAPPAAKAKDDSDALPTAQVWDVDGKKERFQARVTGMGGQAVSCAIAADGTLIALSSGDGPIDLFDGETGKRTATLLGRRSQGVKLAISPDGRTVASVAPDFRIQRWTRDGKSLDPTDPPPGMISGPITGLAFADNDRVVGWMTIGQFAAAWEAPTGRLLTPLAEHGAAIRSIAFEEEGRTLLTSGNESRNFRWDLATGQLNGPVQFHPAHIPGQPRIRPSVTLSANGRLATSIRPPAQPEVFDVETGADLFVVPSPSAAPAGVAHHLSADGTKFSPRATARAGKPGLCTVWDLAARERLIEFDLPPTIGLPPPAAQISPSGNRVVVATLKRTPSGLGEMLTLTGYDVKTGKKLAEVDDPAANANVLVTPLNDRLAVVASNMGRVWMVDYAEGKVLKTIDRLPMRPIGENTVIGPIIARPDGRYFAIGVIGAEQETFGARVYDANGKPLHTFIGHIGPVSTLEFSPDGKSLASGSQDASVLLWDLMKIPASK